MKLDQPLHSRNKSAAETVGFYRRTGSEKRWRWKNRPWRWSSLFFWDYHWIIYIDRLQKGRTISFLGRYWAAAELRTEEETSNFHQWKVLFYQYNSPGVNLCSFHKENCRIEVLTMREQTVPGTVNHDSGKRRVILPHAQYYQNLIPSTSFHSLPGRKNPLERDNCQHKHLFSGPSDFFLSGWKRCVT